MERPKRPYEFNDYSKRSDGAGNLPPLRIEFPDVAKVVKEEMEKSSEKVQRVEVLNQPGSDGKLHGLVSELIKAVNSVQIPEQAKEVAISNIKDLPKPEIKTEKVVLPDQKKYFDSIEKAIQSSSVDIKEWAKFFAKNPDFYLNVRLTDGKMWYRAVNELVAASGRVKSSFVDPNGEPASVRLNADGSVPTSATISTSGLATSSNQTDGSQKSKIVDGSGNVIGATANALDVNIKSGASSGTEYTEDAAAAANPVGGAVIVVRDDARSGGVTSADGDNIALRGTNAGELYVKHLDSIPVTQSGLWTPTTTSGTQHVMVDNFPTIFSVNVQNNVLPTGASTAAKQDTGNTSLATLAGAVAGTEVQVDVLTMPTTTVQATNLDIRDLVSTADSIAIKNSAGTKELDIVSGGDATGSRGVAVWGTDGSLMKALSVTADGHVNIADGGNSITVDASSLPLPTGAATAANQATANTSLATVAGAVAGTEMQVDVVAALPAGTNAIGKLAANSGVDIGDVDITSVTPGTLAANLGKAEDAAHTTGDVGVMMLGVRNDVDGSLVGADGDYAPFQFNDMGAAKVAVNEIVSSAATGTITALDGAVSMIGDGAVVVHVTGTWVATLTFEASVDGTNWVVVQGVPTTGMTAVTTTTANGAWQFAIGGFDEFRVRASLFTSGTVAVALAGAPAGITKLPDRPLTAATDAVTAELGATDNAVLDAIAASVAAIDTDTTTVIGHLDGVEGLLTTIDADTSTIAGAVAGTEVQVDIVAALPAGTNNIGDVDVLSCALPTGAATAANQTTIIGHVDGIETLIGTTNTNTGNAATSLAVMDDWDNAASNGARVSGDVAHDTADAGEPVKIGFKAIASPKGETMVAANDRTNAISDLDGIQVVKVGTTGADLLTEATSNTDGASTASTAFGATASTYNYITAISVFRTDAGTSMAYIDFRDGTAGAVLYRMPLPPTGGAVIASPIPLFKTSANTALAYDVSGALSTVYINCTGYKSKA